MDDNQKTLITKLRHQGLGYSEISSRLNISRNTVKSFCTRKKITVGNKDNGDVCRECGRPLVQPPKSKKRIFCSPECRVNWWHNHPDCIKQRAIYNYKCAYCGKDFSAYGNSHRKYCSHACYIKDRFKGGDKNVRTRL